MTLALLEMKQHCENKHNVFRTKTKTWYFYTAKKEHKT
jgi:hypothetical protein